MVYLEGTEVILRSPIAVNKPLEQGCGTNNTELSFPWTQDIPHYLNTDECVCVFVYVHKIIWDLFPFTPHLIFL